MLQGLIPFSVNYYKGKLLLGKTVLGMGQNATKTKRDYIFKFGKTIIGQPD